MHVLNDHRVQGIPLILETPSFEKPRDVWGREIQVLHCLAGIESENDHGLSETEEKELTDSIREVIKEVGGSNKKSRTTKSTVNGKIKKAKNSIEEHDSDQESSEE